LKSPSIWALSLTAFLALTGGIASGALKTSSASISLGLAEQGAATAECERGTRAIAGGFDAPGFAVDSGGAQVLTLAHARSAKREWTAGANNFGEGSGDLVSHAYCTDSAPKLKAKSKTVGVPPESAGSATARCRKRGEAISGGFATENFEDVFPFESRRLGKRKWKVSGYNDDSDETIDLTAFAYCAKRKLGLRKKSDQTTFDQDSPFLISAEASCKPSQRAVSGGFAGVRNDQVFTLPYRSMRTDSRSWGSAAFKDTSAIVTATFKTFVYCLGKKEI
jgi:hypothetical protein